MWTDYWIGIPYQEVGRGQEGYDCLGLFVAVQAARHGRVVFDPLCTMSVAYRRSLVDLAKQNWRPVARAREGDALLFKVRGLALHLGYALDECRMLHTSQDTGESVIEDYTAAQWGQRLEGMYRYAG